MRTDHSSDWKAGLREAAHMLVFRGWLVLLVGLLSAAVTGVIVGLQPVQYQAQAIISVGGTGSTDGAVALATSDRVMQEVAQLIGQPISPSDWRAHGAVDAPGGGLVRLLVVLPDGVRATKIAASWGQALVGVLQELETSQPGNPTAGPTLVSLPTQAARVSSQWGLKVLTSGVVGLVVSLVGVFVVHAAKIPG